MPTRTGQNPNDDLAQILQLAGLGMEIDRQNQQEQAQQLQQLLAVAGLMQQQQQQGVANQFDERRLAFDESQLAQRGAADERRFGLDERQLAASERASQMQSEASQAARLQDLIELAIANPQSLPLQEQLRRTPGAEGYVAGMQEGINQDWLTQQNTVRSGLEATKFGDSTVDAMKAAYGGRYPGMVEGIVDQYGPQPEPRPPLAASVEDVMRMHGATPAITPSPTSSSMPYSGEAGANRLLGLFSNLLASDPNDPKIRKYRESRTRTPNQ